MTMFEICAWKSLPRSGTAATRIGVHQTREVELGLIFGVSRTITECRECRQDQHYEANQQHRAHRHDWKFYCDAQRRESSSRKAVHRSCENDTMILPGLLALLQLGQWTSIPPLNIPRQEIGV